MNPLIPSIRADKDKALPDPFGRGRAASFRIVCCPKKRFLKRERAVCRSTQEHSFGSHRRRQPSDQQARRRRAPIHPRHGATKAQEIGTRCKSGPRRVRSSRPGSAPDPRSQSTATSWEGDLRREVSMNIKRLMDLGCYRGLRHGRAFRCVASGRTPTPVPARGRRRRSPGKRVRPSNSFEYDGRSG